MSRSSPRQLNNALYQVTVEGAQPSATAWCWLPARSPTTTPSNGLDVVKTFQFDSSYVVDVETAGQAQRRAGARAGRVARGPRRHGGVPANVARRARRCAPPPRRTSPGRSTAKQDSLAAKKVSGNATLDAALQLRGHHGSLLCGGLSARQSRAHHRGHAAQLRSTCPATSSDPNSKKTPADVHRPGGRRHQRRHPPAPLCRPQGDRHSGVDPRHRPRRQGRPANRSSR